MASLKKHPHTAASKELFNNPFLRLQHEVNHAMNDFYHLFDPISTDLAKFDNTLLSPALDLVEDKESYTVEAEMPGMGEEDISVAFEGNRLTIKGEKSLSHKNENKNFISREISYGRYERSINLPLSADVDKASATFKKGMLWVTIPKKAGSKNAAKNIKIKRAE